MAGSLAFLPNFRQESLSLFVLEISVQSLRNLLALVNRYGSKKFEPVFRHCTVFCSLYDIAAETMISGSIVFGLSY